MFALSCFVLIVTILLPIMTMIQQEYSVNHQERKVLYELEEVIHHYRLTGEVNETNGMDGVSFYYEQVSLHVMRICASWKAVNGRDYEHCFYATKQ